MPAVVAQVVTVAPALPAVVAEAAVQAVLLLALAAATGRAAAVSAVVVPARAAAHAPVARPLHAAAPAAVVVAVMKAAQAATATTIRNPHAPTPTWAHTWATPARAIATPAIPVAVRAASLTRCAPAWTAWAAAGAVVVAVIAVATVEVVAMVVDQAQRVAAVAGATGLVGQAVLAALLTAETRSSEEGGHSSPPSLNSAPGGRSGALEPAAVHVLYASGRRPPAVNHPRLQLHAVDFANMPALPHVDDVFVALGTTIAIAGSQGAFRAVDYDAVMATGRAARAAGATRCGVVSAMGANAGSRIFYNRVKGEVERDLQSLGFTTLVIARPSFLMGDRRALQQAPRAGESLSIRLFRWLDPVIPANYRARPGADVARALVHAVQSVPAGLHVLSGRALQPAA